MTRSDLEVDGDFLSAEIGDHVFIGEKEIYLVDSYDEETDSYQLTEVTIH